MNRNSHAATDTLTPVPAAPSLNRRWVHFRDPAVEHLFRRDEAPAERRRIAWICGVFATIILLAISQDRVRVVDPDLLTPMLIVRLAMGLLSGAVVAACLLRVRPEVLDWLVLAVALVAGPFLVMVAWAYALPATHHPIASLIYAMVFLVILPNRSAFLALHLVLALAVIAALNLVFPPPLVAGLHYTALLPALLALLCFHVARQQLLLRRDLFATLIAERETSRELIRLATTDSLTGLANRRHFLGQTEELFRRADSLTLAVLDVDHFKQINDTHGHGTGDAVLAALARILDDPGLLVGRLGGEEFGVVLAGLSPGAARDRLERLRASIAAQPLAAGLTVTVSLGASHRRLDDDSLESLLVRADQALYDAKGAGRDRLVMG